MAVIRNDDAGSAVRNRFADKMLGREHSGDFKRLGTRAKRDIVLLAHASH